MEGLVALGLAILSVPFLLPIASWVASRRLRRRVVALEEAVETQDQRILALTTTLALLRKSAPAHADAVGGDAARGTRRRGSRAGRAASRRSRTARHGAASPHRADRRATRSDRAGRASATGPRRAARHSATVTGEPR